MSDLSTSSPSPASRAVIGVTRAARALVWLVSAWVAVTTTVLALAFVLQLFGANPDAGIAEWIYRSADRAMDPFRGIFEPIQFSDQSTFDSSMLFAIVVYAIAGLALSTLSSWLGDRLLRLEHQRALAAAPATPGTVRRLALDASTGVPGSVVLTGTAWGSAVDVYVSGLDPQRVYALWLELRAGARSPAGEFRAADVGLVHVSRTTAALVDDIVAVGVVALPEPI
jgi:uncharacterized protein YggT (Ycf19 family)